MERLSKTDRIPGEQRDGGAGKGETGGIAKGSFSFSLTAGRSDEACDTVAWIHELMSTCERSGVVA